MEGLGPAAEYSAKVSAWLEQVYHMQMIQIGFPSFLAYQASLGKLPNISGLPGTLLGQQATASAPTIVPAPTAPTAAARALNVNVNLSVPLIRAGFIQEVFTIPPVWKRVAAETLDFLVLFVLKLVITFIAVDFFEMVDLDSFEMPLDILSRLETQEPLKIDYGLAVRFTQEILILELVHRVVVCIFEALCTQRGPMGIPGGATPGKVIMGLKIIKAEEVIALGGNRVRVTPASNLGLSWAALRSVLKNFSLAFFFPVCFSLLFLPHSRTLYDYFSRSIVVENPLRLSARELHRHHLNNNNNN